MCNRSDIKIILICFFTVAACECRGELFQEASEATILRAAREIIAGDPNCALITIDEEGHPRVRTVRGSAPKEGMTIWIATRPSTRKVNQILANNRVTLYFNNDETSSYVSLMGRATLHNDFSTKEKENFFAEEDLKKFWPQYPKDYLLIKVIPFWIEVMGHGIKGHPETWRPQAVILEK